MTLTAAGEELRALIESPMQAIAAASDNLERYRDTPAGRVRINVLEDAVELLLKPVMPIFVDRYPDVAIDISVTNRMIDVVGNGFDAGIRYGGTVPEDMIVQRLSADVRWVAAAAPAYLERFGTPATPDDLARHRCIRLRAGDDRLYRWEFEEAGREFDMAVPGSLTVDDSRTSAALACGGAGLCYGPDFVFAPHLREGALRPVLEDWATFGPGFHLYYSSRRQVPTGLRLLVDLVREMRPLGL